MKKFIILMGFMPLMLALSAQAVTHPHVNRLRLWATPGTMRLVFDLNATVKHQIITLQNPERLVIDLQHAKLVGDIPDIPKDANFVKNIRSGSPDSDILRVVLDLNQPVQAKDFWLKPDKNSEHRLVLDLKTYGNSRVVSRESVNHARELPAGPQVASTGSRVVNHRYDIPAKSTTASNTHRESSNQIHHPLPDRLTVASNVSTTSTYAPHRLPARPSALSVSNQEAFADTRNLSTLTQQRGRDLIIAIDPGHGGKDTGAIGQNGTLEKDVVLQVARRLADRINAAPGMKAVLTRSTDIFIPLRQRVTKARKANADLFVSIHADATANNPYAQGSSVFTLSERGASSEAARLLADKENAADLVGGLSVIEDKDDLLAKVLLDMSMSSTLEVSRHVADNILRRLGRIGEIHKEEVQYAAFAVLKAADIPAMLVETAYISNMEEEAKLKQFGFQTQLAEAIFGGINEHFLTRPPIGSRVAQVVR